MSTAHLIRKRDEAINRGLNFIYRFGSEANNFEDYGSFLVCCFALVGATSRDQRLRYIGRKRAKQLARRWTIAHRLSPSETSSDLLLDCILVCYALRRMGERSRSLENKIAARANGLSTLDLLGFDPRREPPPDDLPFRCECGSDNHRGRKFCKQCKRRLPIKTRYRVWMEALANTYVAERCGTLFGSCYADVLNWLPEMRPYPTAMKAGAGIDDELADAIYAATHIVYTLNDYGTYKLSPRWLPQEFSFLKSNVDLTCAHNEPELLGELLDSLKAFGLPATHQLIARGTDYLLSNQNEDGSWGDFEDEDVRRRCHTTWTAVDGLRSCAWRGERLSLPALKPLLKQRTVTLNKNYS